MGIEATEIGPGVPEWASNILKYLDANEVPGDRWVAKKIRNQVARYTMVDGVLYRRGYSMLLLRCISSEKAKYVLVEIYGRI